MVSQNNELMEKMIEILLSKQALLNEMLALTNTQTSIISSDKLDELEKLIEEKQLRINVIDKLDERFALYFEKLKDLTGVKHFEELDVSAYPKAKQLKEETEAVVSIARNISKIEELNSKKSKGLLDKIGKEIKKINQGKKINQAYNPNSPSAPSYFIDNKK